MCCAVDERPKNEEMKKDIEKTPATSNTPQLQNKAKKEEDPELALNKLLESNGYESISVKVK
jgi:hypothetical protein